MIDLVYNVLRDLSVISRKDRCSFSAHFQRNLNFFIYPEGRKEFYQVKVSSVMPLADEHQALTEAYALFPRHVAKPLGFFAKHGLEFLACEGIRCTEVCSLSGGNDSTVEQTLWMLIEWKGFGGASRPMDGLASLHTAFLDCESLLPGPVAHELEKRIDTFPAQFPSIRQHGDFVCCNMAMSKKNLVIFDWEDFGKICVPGLDVWTFVVDALSDFTPERFSALNNFKDYPPDFVALLRAFSREYGLQARDFLRFMPLYMLLFLHLKIQYGYSQAIIAACKDLLISCITAP